jgi:hypothetical protein
MTKRMHMIRNAEVRIEHVDSAGSASGPEVLADPAPRTCYIAIAS